MTACPRLLDLYAAAARLDPGLNTAVHEHAGKCPTCFDSLTEICLALAAKPAEESPLDEGSMLRLLEKPPEPRDARVRAIFSTAEARAFASRLHAFEKTPEEPREQTQAIVERLRDRLRAAREYSAEYVLKLTDTAGHMLGNLRDAGSRVLICVLRTPALAPAMAGVRAPVYDDVAMVKNEKSAILPIYYSPETLLNLHVTFSSRGMELWADLHENARPVEVVGLTINGTRHQGDTACAAPAKRWEVDVEAETGQHYQAGIRLGE